MAEVQASSASTKTAVADENPASPAGNPSKGRGKTALYLGLAVVVIGAAVFFWTRPAGTTQASPPAAVETMLPLETFVVNLDGSQRAFLRVGITLGLSRPLPRNGKEELPIPLLRDAILSVLSSAQPEQLVKPEGKQKLKADLLKALQERAAGLDIGNVYFTEFLVQM